MVSMEEARRIAAKRLRDISGCTEYDSAYVFFNPRSEETEGGMDAPLAVWKEDGKCFPFDAFVLRGGGKIMRSIEF